MCRYAAVLLSPRLRLSVSGRPCGATANTFKYMHHISRGDHRHQPVDEGYGHHYGNCDTAHKNTNPELPP
jgi:hypothetical protein